MSTLLQSDSGKNNGGIFDNQEHLNSKVWSQLLNTNSQHLQDLLFDPVIVRSLIRIYKLTEKHVVSGQMAWPWQALMGMSQFILVFINLYSRAKHYKLVKQGPFFKNLKFKKIIGVIPKPKL